MTTEVSELRLPPPLRSQLVEQAVAAMPAEAVGLLGGTAEGEVRRVFPLRNLAPHGAFWADPYSQFKALTELSAQNLELLAIYHSHPDGPPEPSPTDVRFAAQWACCQVVIALDASGRAELCGYRWSERGLRDVPICSTPAS